MKYLRKKRPRADLKVREESGLKEPLTVCHSLKRNISQMKAVEDFESTPHKAAPFVVERDMEEQEWNEQRMQKVLPGYSGGRLPGRSAKERG